MIAPGINTQPQSVCVVSGSNVTFSVEASSRDLSYQWFSGEPGNETLLVDGEEIRGSTSDELTIKRAAIKSGYYVVVSNAAGQIISVVATLTIGMSSAN